MARRIDQLGRVVVPSEFRKMLGIHAGDLLEMRVGDRQLVLLKVDPECAICGATDSLTSMHDKHVCEKCVGEIRLDPECALCGKHGELVKLRDHHVCRACVREASVV